MLVTVSKDELETVLAYALKKFRREPVLDPGKRDFGQRGK